MKREVGSGPFHLDFLHVSRLTPHVSLAGVRRGYSAIRCQSVSIWVHPWWNLTTAVNAKTPRGKGTRDRKMTREKQGYITHPGGDSPHQPKPLRLGTFAPLRWFNCFFRLKLSQSWATTRVRLGEVAEPTRPKSDPVVGACHRRNDITVKPSV